jgi:glycerol-3-phosphate dehydrogenase
MKREAQRLEQGPFDLLVIGGGIYGAWTAYDAALRGLSVALLEKGDWASGTSSTSSKLIHGGLRYLEHYRFGLVRRSLKERLRLLSLAPHLVRPSPFYIPLYKQNRVGPFRLKAGLGLYSLFAGKGFPGASRLSFSRGEFREICPFLNEDGLLGGLAYGDGITDDARFTLEIVKGAQEAGAATIHYAEAREIIFRGERAAGAVVQDHLEGSTLEVAASTVVNTAGPWIGTIGGGAHLSRRVRLTKGVHLVFPALPVQEAFLLLTRGESRVFFLIPWYGRTLVGTTDTDYSGHPDGAGVETEDIDYLLDEISQVLVDGTWDKSSIMGFFTGLRALLDKPGKQASDLSREWILMEPRKGLLVSAGGKFTTARADAAVIVDRVLQGQGKPAGEKPPTEERPFPSSPGGDHQAWEEGVRGEGIRLGLDEETALSCSRRYGTAVEGIHKLLREDPDLAGRLTPELAFCRAEVVYCAAGEMVAHLDDLLQRRIPLMLLSRPDECVLEEAAFLAAPHLGWDEDRRRREIADAMKAWKEPFRLLEEGPR